MANTILQLVPLMLGSALVPIWIILMLLVLRGPNGLVRGAALLTGITVARLAQGLVFGYVFGTADGGDDGSAPIASMLLIVLGILLLIAAIKTVRSEPDLDEPPPKWMTMLDRTSAPKMLGLGFLLTLLAAKLWVFTLAAIGIIQAAKLDFSQQITAFLIFVLGAELLLLLPLFIQAIAPRRATQWLRSATTWLERYNRLIKLIVSLIFGILFLWKGIAGFVA